MKSFHYTALDANGEQVSGVIQSDAFSKASEEVEKKGLKLLTLEQQEQQIINEVRPFLFEAIDRDGEEVQGAIPGVSEQEALEILQEKYGYQVKKIEQTGVSQNNQSQQEDQTKEVDVQDVQTQQSSAEEVIQVPQQQPEEQEHEAMQHSQKPEITAEKNEEPILFADSQKTTSSSVSVPNHHEDQLQEASKKIEQMMNKQGLTAQTQERLNHLQGKVQLLKENPDKKRLKNFLRELKKFSKKVERELQQLHQQKWEAYEQKQVPIEDLDYENLDGDAEDQEVPKDQIPAQPAPAKTGLAKWIRIIDEPNQNNEQEVLIKQRYESFWLEVERFSGVLLAFYLGCFFLAYYLKRSGIEDHFLVRIYDATLFKQLVLLLFTFYAVFALRFIATQKRIKSDITLLVIWILFASWLLL